MGWGEGCTVTPPHAAASRGQARPVQLLDTSALAFAGEMSFQGFNWHGALE